MLKFKGLIAGLFADKVHENGEVDIVVDEQPADIQLSMNASQAIAEQISRSISDLPLDDFMPQPQNRHSVAAEKPVRPVEALPKIVETLPSQDQLSGIKWQQIKNLPGYAISQIRKVGRDTFEAFDCFQAFSQNHRNQGNDPLAEVMVVSDFTHHQSAVNALAKMIAEKGVVIDTQEINYGDTMPDYHPRVIIMMTENHTFKLVQDRQEYGAPVDLNSIYAWEGGLNSYRPKLGYPKPNKLEKH